MIRFYLLLTLRELGATEDMLDKITDSAYEGGGYKHITHGEIRTILQPCYCEQKENA